MEVIAGGVADSRCGGLYVSIEKGTYGLGGTREAPLVQRQLCGFRLRRNGQGQKTGAPPLLSNLEISRIFGSLRSSATLAGTLPRTFLAGRMQRRLVVEAHRVEEGATLDGPCFSPTLGSDVTATTSTPYASLELPKPRWKRVLLKISGEALAGDKSSNVDSEIVMRIAREVAAIARLGVEVAVTVGGGNFFRGATWAGASGLDRASADQIGMMATVMNAIFLQASLESLGCPTRVQTAFKMAEVAEPYIRRRAMRHLEKGRVVIFGAGTGNPFFTTDTAAALRAAEIDAEVVLKATNVDGVYDCDPRRNAEARLHDHVSYDEVARNRLSVMDATAITLCAENDIPVVVFNLNLPGNIERALRGERIGTLIDTQGAAST